MFNFYCKLTQIFLLITSFMIACGSARQPGKAPQPTQDGQSEQNPADDQGQGSNDNQIQDTPVIDSSTPVITTSNPPVINADGSSPPLTTLDTTNVNPSVPATTTGGTSCYDELNGAGGTSSVLVSLMDQIMPGISQYASDEQVASILRLDTCINLLQQYGGML